jgi:oligopeptide/dipeptide ABC transporter ATP-binding protein
MRSIRGRKISFIFRDSKTSLNPTLDIGRQITEILETHLDMDKQAARERTIELLDMVGVPDAAARINDRAYQLSDGMRQRVMIAMALACNPMIVIADEPTAESGATTQAQLLELMKEMVARLNTSLLIATQNLGVVIRYTRRVYVMYAGRIVESGPSEIVFNKPCHPYTLGLLRSVPRLGVNKSVKKMTPLHGSSPSLINTPQQCAFLPRCIHKTERCEQEPLPDMRPVGEGHHIRCYVDLRETP